MALADLQALEREAVMGTYLRNPVEFVRGEGTRLWDDEGNEYLDFLAGISVAQLGHCHPAVVAAVRDQAGRLMHVGNLYYRARNALGGAAVRAVAGRQGVLCNSGTEAIECAIKPARRSRPGGDFVVLEGFHGRTMGALSATPRSRSRRRSRRSCPASVWRPGMARSGWTSARPRCCSSLSRARAASTRSASCSRRRAPPATSPARC